MSCQNATDQSNRLLMSLLQLVNASIHLQSLLRLMPYSGATTGGNGGSRLWAPLERGRRVQTAMFLPAIRSLERRARYLFYCMYVCLFVRSTISRQPAGRFNPKFACRRTLVPDVSSPLLGVGGPRRAEKEANEIFVTMGVDGEFLHFGGF